jgi:hypothetical protein
VAGLVLLVNKSILGGGGTAAQGGVVILGNLLVGLFAGLGTGALDRLRDVVSGVPVEDMLVTVRRRRNFLSRRARARLT